MNKMAKGLKKYREGVKSGLIKRVTVKRPSMIKSIKDKCMDCSSNYVDGRLDCEIPECSLYYWMPYGESVKGRRAKRKEEKMLRDSRNY